MEGVVSEACGTAAVEASVATREGRKESEEGGREMGMGMEEGEWAAKRGPTHSQQLRQKGSLIASERSDSGSLYPQKGGAPKRFAVSILSLILLSEFLFSISCCLDVFKHLVLLVSSFGL